MKASEQDNVMMPNQPCFGKMDLSRHGGLEVEIGRPKLRLSL